MTTRQRVFDPVWVYRLLICLLVLLGIQPLLRLPQEIGQLYLGVPLSPSLRGLLFVNVETSAHWPGIQAGLRPGDRILSVEGRSVVHAPDVLMEVLANHRAGDPVQVEVLRGAERLSVTVPLDRYTVAEALELHGLWFLAGLTTALAGWLLFRPPTELMALSLALIAGFEFVHGNTGYIDPRFGSFDFYPLEPMWTYGYNLLGATALHSAWRFPLMQPTARPQPPPRRIPGWLIGWYGIGFTVGTTQEFTRAIKWIAANELLTQVSLFLGAVGITGALLWLVWLCLQRRAYRADVRVVAGAWGFGMLLALMVGIGPFWSSEIGMLLAQFLFSIAVIYPLLLVYAVRQVKLVGALEREVVAKQRWADLAQELQRFREGDLRRLANELHDTVLADLRAVELHLAGLIPSGNASPAHENIRADSSRPTLTAELQALREMVQQIERQARQVTIRAMPLDFQTIGLREALEEALERFRRMSPEVDARLEVGPFDAEPPPAVREAAYWIAMSALNNSREHAQAPEVRVFVSSAGGELQVVIRDSGIGFQGAEVQGSRGAEEQQGEGMRGLGLRNMRARAEEVGGTLDIDSGPWGTMVRFRLAMPRERPMRVFVVEDSEAFVAGLRAGLAPWSHEIEIVGTAGDAQTALALVQKLQPDIVLLDLRIGQGLAAEATHARYGLQALFALPRVSGARCVVMSFFHDPGWLRVAAEAGAWAFWHKDQEVSTLVELLRRVVAGERLLMPQEGAGVEKGRLVEQLSPREWEVLLYLDQGLSNREIADRLSLSVRTVEKHVQGLREKLGARSRLEAVARARELGLLEGGRPEVRL